MKTKVLGLIDRGTNRTLDLVECKMDGGANWTNTKNLDMVDLFMVGRDPSNIHTFVREDELAEEEEKKETKEEEKVA